MKTKFNLGDIVIIINNNKIIKCVVSGIKLTPKRQVNTNNFKDFKNVEYLLIELETDKSIIKKIGKDNIAIKNYTNIIRTEDTIFSSIDEMVTIIKENYKV